MPEGPPDGVGGSAAGLFALGGSSAVAVVGRGTVYRTDDGGATWAAVGRAPDINDDIYAKAAALGPDGRLYVGLLEIGSNGEGWVYRTEEVVTVAAEPGATAPVKVGLNVYPNPTSRSLTVEVTLPAAAAVDMALFDVSGRRVAVVHAGALGAGEHAFALDTAALPSGVYVVHVTARTDGAVQRAALRFIVVH